MAETMDGKNDALLQLVELLTSMFDAGELRQFVRMHLGAKLAHALPGDGVSLSTLAFEMALLLERYGLADDGLFVALAAARPGQRQRIAAVAKIWGFSIIPMLPSGESGQDASVPGKRLLGVFAAADRDYWAELTQHLSPFLRRGQFELAEAHVDIEAPMAVSLDVMNADMVVYLLSADLLASPLIIDVGEYGIAGRGGERDTAILPVVVRPCLWTASPFARYAVFPRAGGAIATASSSDDAWLEVVAAIERLLQADAAAVPMKPIYRNGGDWDYSHETTRSLEPTKPPDAGPPTGPVLPLHEVFRTMGMPEHTLVTSAQHEELCYQVSVPGQLLVVEGPSGIGKTVAVRHAIQQCLQPDRATAHWDWLDIDVKVAEARQQIDDLLAQSPKDVRGYVVVDDAHYLDTADKAALGRFAKAVADSDNRRAKLVFIGIPRVHEALLSHVFDLSGRMRTVRMTRATNEDIDQLIDKGARALNVHFRYSRRLASAARGSFVIAQRMCEFAARRKQIFQTSPLTALVDCDVPDVLDGVLDDLRGAFYLRLQRFITHAQGAEAAVMALLWHLQESPDGGVQVELIRPRYPDIAASFAAFAREFDHEAEAEWRQLFYCDPAQAYMSIEDPRLQFYLLHLNWQELGRDCGLKLQVNGDTGQLIIIPPPSLGPASVPVSSGRSQAQRVEPDGRDKGANVDNNVNVDVPFVRLVHLSDFHFRDNTHWDAATVLGRLGTDIENLRHGGLGPDLVVVTGDIAFSGMEEEFDLARTWMSQELLPAAGLTASELIIAPGNHDVDRRRIKAAAGFIVDGIRNQQSQQALTSVMEDASSAAMLLDPLAAYVACIDQLGAVGAPLTRPWHKSTHRIRGLTVHCASLASAWLSAGDNDRGRLLMGLRQMTTMLEGADDADVVIAAMHHPWDYLAEWDRDVCVPELRRRVGVLLRGHLHSPNYAYSQNPVQGELLELAAGSCYESSQYRNGYNVIELRPREGKARIYPRFWDTNRREWRADLNVFDGKYGEMPLRRG